MVIAHSIPNLYFGEYLLVVAVALRVGYPKKQKGDKNKKLEQSRNEQSTYMQVDLLSIPLLAAYNRGNNDELVLGDEVTDASLVSTAVARGGGKIELQGRGNLDDEKE